MSPCGMSRSNYADYSDCDWKLASRPEPRAAPEACVARAVDTPESVMLKVAAEHNITSAEQLRERLGGDWERNAVDRFQAAQARAEKAERELAAARRRNRLLSRQLTEDFRVGATCDTEAERIAACRAADDQQGIARSSVAKLPAYHRGPVIACDNGNDWWGDES